jgi:hypothetical protein
VFTFDLLLKFQGQTKVMMLIFGPHMPVTRKCNDSFWPTHTLYACFGWLIGIPPPLLTNRSWVKIPTGSYQRLNKNCKHCYPVGHSSQKAHTIHRPLQRYLRIIYTLYIYLYFVMSIFWHILADVWSQPKIHRSFRASVLSIVYTVIILDPYRTLTIKAV